MNEVTNVTNWLLGTVAGGLLAVAFAIIYWASNNSTKKK